MRLHESGCSVDRAVDAFASVPGLRQMFISILELQVHVPQRVGGRMLACSRVSIFLN